VWNAFRIKKLLNANGALLFSTISRKFPGKARVRWARAVLRGAWGGDDTVRGAVTMLDSGPKLPTQRLAVCARV